MTFVVVVRHRARFEGPNEVDGVPCLQQVVKGRAIAVSVAACETEGDGITEGK